MKLSTVIFDMDGLLIDSEPLWEQAAATIFSNYGINLTTEQYNSTTGLRTREFVDWWFRYFGMPESEKAIAEKKIVHLVMDLIASKGTIMPGVQYIFDFFQSKSFKIGLATSSPVELIELVAKMANIRHLLQATASAEDLDFGKPHPQVYLNCAEQLGVSPLECVCFEDSFNGMIAAKAARMKCVVVPHHSQIKEDRWAAADLKMSSLQNFGELHFNLIN